MTILYLINVKMAFHRKIAVEGEEVALKAYLQELPSWVHFPDVERVEWMNHIMTLMWPQVTAYTGLFRD